MTRCTIRHSIRVCMLCKVKHLQGRKKHKRLTKNQGEVSLFVFFFSSFLFFVFYHFSCVFFDIRIWPEYRILTFEILF